MALRHELVTDSILDLELEEKMSLLYGPVGPLRDGSIECLGVSFSTFRQNFGSCRMAL